MLMEGRGGVIRHCMYAPHQYTNVLHPVPTCTTMIVAASSMKVQSLESSSTDSLPPGFWDPTDIQYFQYLEHCPYCHDVFSITKAVMVATTLNGHAQYSLEVIIQLHTWQTGLIADL
jgi:hypothetical protein